MHFDVSPWVMFSALSAGVFWVGFSYRGPSWVKTFVKTVPLLGLALASAAANLSFWLTAALALSALGDMALSRPGARNFQLGLGAFALAHLAFVGLFAIAPVPQDAYIFKWADVPYPASWQDRPWVLALAGLAVLWAAALVLFVRHSGRMLPFVLIYMVVITAMVVAAVAHVRLEVLILHGVAMFVLSDFVLGLQQFRALPRVWDTLASLAIWPLYFGGQLLIFLSFQMIAQVA